jgi:peptidoglycan/LPS O-acetylase OafA/YrhL
MTTVGRAPGLGADTPVTVGHRFPALDGLRGLAALAVVTTHVGFQTGRTGRPGALGGLLARGDFGVTVFFLLSGFLLYRPLSRGGVVLRTYARRRALRVLPAYWLAVLLSFLLLPSNARQPADVWWEHLLLVQVYLETQLPDGLTQMWSLCTEVAFYVLLPVFAAVVVRRRRGQPIGGRVDLLALGALAAVGVLWTAVAAGPSYISPSSRLWLPGYLDWFALGMALAVLHHRAQRTPEDRVCARLAELGRAPGTCLSVAVLLLLLAATPLGGPRLLDPPTHLEAVLKHLLYGASALFLLLPAVFVPAEGTPWTRLLSSRPLHLVGQVSYSVFALHLVVLYFVLEAMAGGPFRGRFWTVWVVTTGASLVVAAVSYRLVERPLTDLGRRSR